LEGALAVKKAFRLKQLENQLAEADMPGQSLKRRLTSFDLMMLGIGAIVGTGIFAVAGLAAAGTATQPGAGPGVMLAFAITAAACGFCALCYAEMASMVPVSGSAYTYAYMTMGEFIAWIIGWDLIIEYAVGNVAVAISWSAYFHQLLQGLGIHLPAWISVDYRSAMQAGNLAASGGEIGPGMTMAHQAWLSHPTILGIPLIFNFLAAGIVGLVTWLLVIGVKESARVNNVMVAIKVAILLFFIVVGAFYVDTGNWTPMLPNGMLGVWGAASLIFFAYIGFDAVSTTAEECKDPAKTLPRGIIGSLIICTVLYMATAAVLTGIVPWRELGVPDPLAETLSRLNLNWAAGIVSFGAVLAMTTVLLVFQYGQPRIFFSMARDGLLPAGFSRIHKKYGTPHITTIWTGAAVALFAGVANLNEIVELTNIGTLFAFVLVCIGVLILRKRNPEAKRGFRTPWVPVVPLLGVGMCLYLMLGLPWVTWLRFGIWLLLGVVIYVLYGYRRSKLHKL
jgi:basic amino acid/polyamine antiporter, APA family